MVALADMRRAGGDQRLGRILAARDAQLARARVRRVDEGAVALLRPEELVGDRLVDHAGDDLVVALEADRDGEVRHAVEEVGGAVERVDDPAVAAVALGLAAFLAEEAVVRPGGEQLLRSVRSARTSAWLTKSPGPFSEICRCSTSPKSRFIALAAAKAARIITVMVAERGASERRSGGPDRSRPGCIGARPTRATGCLGGDVRGRGSHQSFARSM